LRDLIAQLGIGGVKARHGIEQRRCGQQPLTQLQLHAAQQDVGLAIRRVPRASLLQLGDRDL
jgi:hypothetical protein